MRAPVGIQLGRGVRPGLLRVLEALTAVLLLLAGWGAVSLRAARAEIAELRPPGAEASPESSPVAATPPGLEPERAREASALLVAGAMNAPDLGAAFEAIRALAPPGARIAGVEARWLGNLGRVEAVIAAEGASAGDIAAFLAALSAHPFVLSTEVISETRQSDGAATTRITAQLDLGSGAPARP